MTALTTTTTTALTEAEEGVATVAARPSPDCPRPHSPAAPDADAATVGTTPTPTAPGRAADADGDGDAPTAPRSPGTTTEPPTQPQPSRGLDHDDDEPEASAARIGQRLASHLDMLAETVRAIVTNVTAAPAGATTGPRPPSRSPSPPAAATDAPTMTTTTTTRRVTRSSTTGSAGRSEYSLEIRRECVARHEAGASHRQIATEMGMPVTTVQTIIKRARELGGVVPVHRSGRPRVTDAAVERAIEALVREQPTWSAREVQERLQATHEGFSVSFETVRRRVRECRKQLQLSTSSSRTAATETTTTTTTTTATENAARQSIVGGGDDDRSRSDVVEGGAEDEHEADDRDREASSDDDMSAGDGMEVADDEPESEVDGHEEAEEEDDADHRVDDRDTTVAEAVTEAPTAGAKAKKKRRQRGSEYTPEFRQRCVDMHTKLGKSYQTIATELDIPQDSVRAIIRKAKRTGTVISAPRSGRPRKTTELIDRVILQAVRLNQRSTAKQIQDDLLNIYEINVSCETIRRRVREHTKQRLVVSENATTSASPAADASTAPANPKSRTATRSAASRPATRNGKTTTRQEPPSQSNATAGACGPDTDPTPTPAKSLKRKRSEYSVEVRERCVALHAQGIGYRKIGEQLNMPHTTVRAIVDKVQRTGSLQPAPRSGRPRKTDEILDKVILQTVKANSKCSARMIQAELQLAYDVTVSCETIRRRVKDYMRQKHLFAETSSSGESIQALARSEVDDAVGGHQGANPSGVTTASRTGRGGTTTEATSTTAQRQPPASSAQQHEALAHAALQVATSYAMANSATPSAATLHLEPHSPFGSHPPPHAFGLARPPPAYHQHGAMSDGSYGMVMAPGPLTMRMMDDGGRSDGHASSGGGGAGGNGPTLLEMMTAAAVATGLAHPSTTGVTQLSMMSMPQYQLSAASVPFGYGHLQLMHPSIGGISSGDESALAPSAASVAAAAAAAATAVLQGHAPHHHPHGSSHRHPQHQNATAPAATEPTRPPINEFVL